MRHVHVTVARADMQTQTPVSDHGGKSHDVGTPLSTGELLIRIGSDVSDWLQLTTRLSASQFMRVRIGLATRRPIKVGLVAIRAVIGKLGSDPSGACRASSRWPSHLLFLSRPLRRR